MSDIDNVADTIAMEILDSEIKIPPLPSAATRLMALTSKSMDDIDIAEISDLIETDPGLLTRILQLANSSYFGTINEIIGLRQAIMHIGLEETISAISWLFYQKALPRFPNMEGLTCKDYWAHSWACAVSNRILGHPANEVETLPGELYIAGLLHGIGKLIFAMYRPDDFLQCIHNSRDFSQPLEEAEKEIFGTTDTLIACKIMESWHLPANICAAVRYYQNPGAAPKEHHEIAALTQFAYYIANISGVGNSGDEFCYDLSQTWISQNWSSPLAQEQRQKKIVEDVHSTLQKKAVSVTGVEPRGTVKQEEVKKKVKDRGFWAWLRSLLGF